MPRATLDAALRGLQQFPGLAVREVIRLSPDATHGLVLSERPDVPGVLGLGAIDRDGDATAVGLTPEEATQLRDALDRWLDESETASYPAAAPDPWTNPDAASASQPPPF